MIVVYKVDRLTRSVADFAKLVELFDAHPFATRPMRTEARAVVTDGFATVIIGSTN